MMPAAVVASHHRRVRRRGSAAQLATVDCEAEPSQRLDALIRRTQCHSNQLDDVPRAFFALRKLKELRLDHNMLTSVSPALGWLTTLNKLWVRVCLRCAGLPSDLYYHVQLCSNRLSVLPREIGCLRNLEFLSLTRNELVALPAEVGLLEDLQCLYLSHNRLAWLPLEMEQLSPSAYVSVFANPMPLSASLLTANARTRLCDIVALSTHIGAIRHRAGTICIALQELGLPALVTLDIVDAAIHNNVRMAAKWDLIVAVKHFHDR